MKVLHVFSHSAKNKTTTKQKQKKKKQLTPQRGILPLINSVHIKEILFAIHCISSYSQSEE